MKFISGLLLAALLAVGATACRNVTAPGTDRNADAATPDAQTFLTEANDTSLRLSNEANEAGWVQSTFITPDTEKIAARANAAYITAVTDYAKRAARYDNVQGPPDVRR